MWASRHYHQGVVEALLKVQDETRSKTGRRTLTGGDLLKQVFSPALPRPSPTSRGCG